MITTNNRQPFSKISSEQLKKIFNKAKVRRREEKLSKKAAVFMLLFYEKHKTHLLTILKTDNQGYPWRNQIALPGGHLDPNDKSNLEAAYRELKEELNITKEQIDFISSIGYYKTINQVDIEVFIGLWKNQTELKYDKKEIAETIKIPLQTLWDTHIKNNYSGRIPEVFELIYPYQEIKIWGVTAKIIHSFLEKITPHIENF